MGSLSREGHYVLGRDSCGSVRLDAQHLLWRLQTGYVLHPKIPVTEGMKIAELGTGTGMWIMDLAEELPESVQLYGYDISESQYPARSNWPANVSFGRLDSLGETPPSLVGQYDVVHLRFWCCIIKGNDPSPLIRQAQALLKPGGYLQWEDAHVRQVVCRGKTAEEFRRMSEDILDSVNIRSDWVSDISSHVRQSDLEVLEHELGWIKPSLVTLCTSTSLMGHLEFFQFVEEAKGKDALPSGIKSLVDILFNETKKDASFHWRPVTLLARKPNA